MSYEKKWSVFDTCNINTANTQYVISGERQVNWEHNRRTNKWTWWMHVQKANASLQVTSSKSTETTYHISKCMRCMATWEKNITFFLMCPVFIFILCFSWPDSPSAPRPAQCWGSAGLTALVRQGLLNVEVLRSHSVIYTTLRKTPSDKCLAPCRDLLSHKAQLSHLCPLAGFEPAFPANEWLHTHALDWVSTGNS
jgi:hypothetical protein